MNVLEAYDFVICSVCCINSSNSFLNIFDNFIAFKSKYFSLAEIIKDSLNIDMTNQESSKQICHNCKIKIVDFFIFKKRNEEARKIYRDSQYKALILDVADNSPDDSNSQIYFTFNDNESSDEIFNDDLLVEAPVEINEEISFKKKEYPENWERTKRKIAKNMGKSYVATNGKIVESKKIKVNCGSKCRMQCNSRISEAARIKNFNDFYALADIELQRKFILDHIQIYEPKKHTKLNEDGRKTRSIQRIFFLDGEKEGEVVQVCKSMFINTLVVSSQILDTIQIKATQKFGSMSDLRGKYPRKRF